MARSITSAAPAHSQTESNTPGRTSWCWISKCPDAMATTFWSGCEENPRARKLWSSRRLTWRRTEPASELGADLYQHKAFQIEALNRFIDRLQSLCPAGDARP